MNFTTNTLGRKKQSTIRAYRHLLKKTPLSVEEIIYDYLKQLDQSEKFENVVRQINSKKITIKKNKWDGIHTVNHHLKASYFPVIYSTRYGNVDGGLFVQSHRLSDCIGIGPSTHLENK